MEKLTLIQDPWVINTQSTLLYTLNIRLSELLIYLLSRHKKISTNCLPPTPHTPLKKIHPIYFYENGNKHLSFFYGDFYSTSLLFIQSYPSNCILGRPLAGFLQGLLQNLQIPFLLYIDF